MAVIELTDPIFYMKGVGGVSRIVGNDWDNGVRYPRVCRYKITMPATGAYGISLTFYTIGQYAGDHHVPIRFYIGEDPESHVNAGPDYEYTGELVMSSDYMTFTGTSDILLMPGKTYYLWLFPGNDLWGNYYWFREGYVSTLEPKSAAFIIPITRGKKWWNAMVYCIFRGAWWLGALCVVKDGKWYLAGSSK